MCAGFVGSSASRRHTTIDLDGFGSLSTVEDLERQRAERLADHVGDGGAARARGQGVPQPFELGELRLFEVRHDLAAFVLSAAHVRTIMVGSTNGHYEPQRIRGAGYVRGHAGIS